MFEKIKPTLEKDYYLNSNPCFAVEKQLLITYIYPNHVFVEKNVTCRFEKWRFQFGRNK